MNRSWQKGIQASARCLRKPFRSFRNPPNPPGPRIGKVQDCAARQSTRVIWG